MKLAIAVLVTGCSFTGSGKPTDAATDDGGFPIDASPGDGDPDAPDGPPAPVDGPNNCWPFTTTNFNSCSLLAASPDPTVIGGMIFDTDMPAIPGIDVVQANGLHALVVHVSSLTVTGSGNLVVNGSRGLIFAVDNSVSITGIIQVGAGAGIGCNLPQTGAAGTTASAVTGGGGGGGGAGGGTDGSDGGDGAGIGPGTKGGKGIVVADASVVSPLRGGCPGGVGGGLNPALGGVGGGAFQITAKQTIALDNGSIVTVAGLGGRGGGLRTGGGGGGAGGAILLEGNVVTLDNSAVVCADGGSGGQGGSATAAGGNGVAGACTGVGGAVSTALLGAGGPGGVGGFRNPPVAGSPGGAAVSAAGGGGGGASGSIRFRTITNFAAHPQSVTTPNAVTN